METKESCMWIFQIHNCKESKQLNIINIIGIIYTSLIILILIITFTYIFIKKKEIKLLEKLNFCLLFSFFIRLIYLILLFIKDINIILLCLLQEIGWIVHVGIYNYLIFLIIKLLDDDNYGIIKKIYMKKIIVKNNTIYIVNIISIFYMFTFLCSLVSGIFFQYENKKGYIFLGLQFSIWCFIISYIGSFFYLFLKRYNKQLKKILKNQKKEKFITKNLKKIKISIKKIKAITNIVIINVIIFPFLWMYQAIHMYFMQELYTWNVITMSLLWYWLAMSLGSTFFVFLLIYHLFTFKNEPYEEMYDIEELNNK